MKAPLLDDVIAHVLTIVEGHCGIRFECDPNTDRDDYYWQSLTEIPETYFEDGGDDIEIEYHSRVTWKSKPVRPGTGQFGFVAESVRLQISLETTLEDAWSVARDHENFVVSVAFIVGRHDGGEQPLARKMRFHGPYFYRFE